MEKRKEYLVPETTMIALTKNNALLHTLIDLAIDVKAELEKRDKNEVREKVSKRYLEHMEDAKKMWIEYKEENE